MGSLHQLSNISAFPQFFGERACSIGRSISTSGAGSMAAGKRLFELVAKSLTRRSSDSVVVKSASSASEIRKAEESAKLWLKDSRRQLKQDREFGNRDKDGSDEFKRILLEAAYREYFHAFLTCACALGTPFAIFCVIKRIK